jgi:folate-binding protein YgfZ
VETRPPDATGTTQLAALGEGRAFVELAGWRAISVGGTDARRWLHDLVTADVEGLRPGESRRSLLLTPTGRIRADFHVAGREDSFLLLQAPDQPEPVDEILAPYVLSSDVRVEDRTHVLAAFAVLGGSAAEDGAHGHVSSPSVLGPGHDVVVSAGEPVGLLREGLIARGLPEADARAVEVWRIRRGVPRMGADFGQGALPAEAGLEHTIDLTKGCFLGQESVAKVRNLGRPPRLFVAVRSAAAVARGDTVFAAGAPVGEVTSAATAGDGTEGTRGIALVRWDAVDTAMSTASGPLVVRQIR